MSAISRDFHFPGLHTFVADYVDSCDTCQRNKIPRQPLKVPLKPLPIPEQPWSSISMDWITDLPSVNQLDAILVIVDRFTKLAHFIPTTKSCTAPQVADLFLHHVIRLHGFPRQLITDRDPVFTSIFWQHLLKNCNVRPSLSTAYHPQTDGQTERTIQTLEQYLRQYCDYQQHNWPALLSLAEFAYNNSTHSSTKQSPFYTTYGYHPVPFPCHLPAHIPAPTFSSHLLAPQNRPAECPSCSPSLTEKCSTIL
jgi:transposase InsO family protein